MNIDKLDYNNILLCIITLFIIYIIFNSYNFSYEKFVNKDTIYKNYADKNAPYETTLYKTLTDNCKPEYCNLNVWGHKVDIPNDYQATNYSSASGCCIVPSEFKDNLDKRFGNGDSIKNNPNEYLSQFSDIFKYIKESSKYE
jgi:hypothetical protein